MSDKLREAVEKLWDGDSTRNASYKAGFNACKLKVLELLAAQPPALTVRQVHEIWRDDSLSRPREGRQMSAPFKEFAVGLQKWGPDTTPPDWFYQFYVTVCHVRRTGVKGREAIRSFIQDAICAALERERGSK
jgi:hypothetical protein